VLASGVSQLINAAAYDIDGDGIPEIAVAQGFTMSPKTSKGQVGLLTHGADVTAPWTYKEIDAVPTAHRLRWIDADGSGKKMLAMAPLIGADSTPPDYKAPMSILFYRAPDWKREAITDALTGPGARHRDHTVGRRERRSALERRLHRSQSVPLRERQVDAD
jgi:hypothetical protein